MSTHLSTTVTQPVRLDRAVQALTGLSRAGVRGLLDHECVRINGVPGIAGQLVLNAGDVIAVKHDPHTRYREKPVAREDPAYRLLFEDEHVLVVDKAAHVLTVPAPGGKGKTLIEALQRHVGRGGSRRGRQRLHVVHRLDRGVSGAIVFAKSALAASRLKQQFAVHKPQRIYLAIVNGLLEQDRGTFRSHLATGATLKQYSTKQPGKGDLAVTHYRVLAHGHGTTVVRVQLETGRRNQIRVHFSEAGHPVLGDPRYAHTHSTSARPEPTGAKRQIVRGVAAHPKWKARRLALHAMSLAFEHPITRRGMRFEAELPAEFAPFTKGLALRLDDPPADVATGGFRPSRRRVKVS